MAYITVKGGPKRGGGGDSKRGFLWGRGGEEIVQYCNQWPAMLDFESMFDI